MDIKSLKRNFLKLRMEKNILCQNDFKKKIGTLIDTKNMLLIFQQKIG